MSSEGEKCKATVIVEYDKDKKKIESVKIANEPDFLNCVKGEAKSATASAVKQTDSNESEVGDGETISEAYGQKKQGGKRRRKSRRRGKRGGRKSKRRSSKKARKSRKSKRRSGKKSKSRRRRK